MSASPLVGTNLGLTAFPMTSDGTFTNPEMRRYLEWLVELIRCPKTGQGLSLLDGSAKERWETLAGEGKLVDGLGQTVAQLTGVYLVNEGATCLYPIREGSIWIDSDSRIEIAAS